MKFAVVSIFPEMIEAFLSRGIVSRARANKTLEIEVIQLRDYTHDAHRTTDDYVYGGRDRSTPCKRSAISVAPPIEREAG